MIELSVSEMAVFVLALVLGGAFTGLLAGIFGIGGGVVLVPVLFQLFSFFEIPDCVRMQLCVGTSLAIIAPTSYVSFRRHSKNGFVLKEVLHVWAIPIVLSVCVGALLSAYVSGVLNKIAFSVIGLLSAVKLICRFDHWQLGSELPSKRVMWAYGAFIGASSSLMGVGGGVVANMLMNLHARPIHNSIATSSGVGVLISFPGAILYALLGWRHESLLPPFSLGYVSLIAFILIAPIAAFIAPYGANVAKKLNKRTLELAFGFFLLLSSVRILVSI